MDSKKNSRTDLFPSKEYAYLSKDESSAEFFASNNTKEINTQMAYDRLEGEDQYKLENKTKHLLQRYNVARVKFENILGLYKMCADKNLTEDNTEHFKISLCHHWNDEKYFSFAKELAMVLHQESVAVLLPSDSTIGEITLHFVSSNPGVNEVIKLLHKKLPSYYNDSYSLHVTDANDKFENARVTKIEWLGSKMKLEDIKKSFPLEKINYRYGKVFLVFQDGHKEQL